MLFVYPTIKMVQLSLTNAPADRARASGSASTITSGSPRTACFRRRLEHRLFRHPVGRPPSTLAARSVALGVNRLKGWTQSVVLAAFFLPYILPVSVVFRIWSWMFDKDFGIAQYAVQLLQQRAASLDLPHHSAVHAGGRLRHHLVAARIQRPALFIAGLRNISTEIYEAAGLDGAGRWAQFTRITWPLIWPVTVLVFTIQLILQLKIFDQVYLFANGGRVGATMVMVQYIFREAFQLNKGGLAAAAAVVLFVLIVVLSVLQFQLLKARGAR